jgi:D-cysteine desulfhydrase
MQRPLLFQRFPALRGKVPWVELGRFPTPIEPMARLGQQLGCDGLYVKRDDRSAARYGGNKVRKLEFVLGDVLRLGRRSIVTFGAAGSNHLLATALYARERGIDTLGLVMPQPAHEYVRQNLRCDWALGCELEPVPDTWAMARRGPRSYLRQWTRSGGRPYLLAPGGSSPLGVLGYVEAALEIAEQVAAGLVPEPDTVVVPVGSAGTMAGLLLGLRLAGLRTEAVGVRVYDRGFANEWAVAGLARAALALLRWHDRSIPSVPLPANGVRILHEHFGTGYAEPTQGSAHATALARELEGLELDCTYSGKAMAGLVDLASRPAERGRVMLFIDTYSSQPLDELARGFPGPQVLPPELRRYFDEEC